MTTYQMSMPILIYNLGVEMVYVLCSRLKAQNIPQDKSVKVVHDVVTSLFDKKFTTEIQKKQEISRHLSVRQLFEKLAHSSIMRLNSSSMNKLFDLMLMSVKLQLVRVKYAEELYQLTMNHLNSLLDILIKLDPKANEDVIILVKESIDYVTKTYGNLSAYEFLILRQNLLRFFQGKNVKVSIFIQDGLQSHTGTIYLPMVENAPPSVKLPGKVNKYKSNGETDKEYLLNLKLSTFYTPPKSVERIHTFTTELGTNIYHSDKRKNEDPFSSKILSSNLLDDINSNPQDNRFNHTLSAKDTTSYLQDEEARKKNLDIVKKEFNDLADLIGVQTNIDEQNLFKVDLFMNRRRQSNNPNQQGNNYDDGDDIIDIERDNNLDRVKGMFEDFNVNENNQNNNDDDDLLALMDKAANR